MSTRAEQRRLRQLEIENEQRLEDVEALKMTEEQRDILLRTFQSVKFEYRDLDGLSWTDPIRQQLKQPEDVANVTQDQDQQQLPQPSFVVLSKAELAVFSPEDTIRVSAVHRSCSPQHEVEPPIHTNYNFETPVLGRGKRDGIRARSPVKGLFSTASDAIPNSAPGDHCSSRHIYDSSIIIEAALSKTDDQATIRLRESPYGESWSHSPTSPTLCTNPSPVSAASSTSPRMQPPPRPTTTMTKNAAGAGIITSIFRSPVFTVPKRSPVQCSVVSTPKSSPSLASICSFSSP